MVRPMILQSGGSWGPTRGTGIPKLHEEEKHVAHMQRMYVAFQSYHISEKKTPFQAPGPTVAYPLKLFKTAESAFNGRQGHDLVDQ